MLTGILKRVIRPIKAGEVRPEFSGAAGAMRAEITNSKIFGNKEFYLNKIENMRTEVDSAYANRDTLKSGEMEEILNLDAELQNTEAAISKSKGGLFTSGSTPNEIDSFRTYTEGINEDFTKSSPGTHGFAKFKSAVQNSLQNKGKKALSLPEDYSPDLDGFVGLKAEREVLEKAINDGRVDEFLDYDGQGVGDGFIQNNLKMMDHERDPGMMASQISSFFSNRINSTYKKHSIAVPRVEQELLGAQAALKHLDFMLDEVYPKLTDNTGNYRKGITHNQFKANLEKTRTNLHEKLIRLEETAVAKAEMSKHNGKFLGQTLDEIKVVDRKLNGAGLAVMDILKGHTASVFSSQMKGQLTPRGISNQQVLTATEELSRAFYLLDALGLGKKTVKETAETANKLDSGLFPSLGDEAMQDFLDSSLVVSDNFLDNFYKRVDEIEIQILNKEKVKSMTVNDHSIGKNISNDIEAGTAEGVRTFKMANDVGFTGVEKNKLKPELVNLGKYLDDSGAESSITGKSVVDNAEKVIGDGFFNKSTERVREMFPALSKFFKNNGATDSISDSLTIINRFNNKIDSVSKGVDYLSSKYRVFGEGKYIGMFASKNIDLPPKERAIYQSLVELNKTMKSELGTVGYFTDSDAINFGGSIVNRSKQNMITKQDFKAATDALRRHESAGNFKKVVEAAMKDLDASGDDIVKWSRVMEDVIDPFGAEVRLSKQLAQAIVQTEFAKSLVKSKDILFTKAPGYRKVTESGMNAKILEDILGTSNIYMPEAFVKNLNHTIREFGDVYSQTAKEMTKEFTFAGAAGFARHMALMFPFTRVMVDSGNVISAWSQLGIPPADFFRHYKNYYSARKSMSTEYKDFLKSGVASQSGLSSVVNRQGKSFGKNSKNGFLKKYNILDRDSDLSNMAYSHILDTPDEMFRFMAWKELSSEGMPIGDIIKTIEKTIGVADNAPSIVKQASNIPGGDVFMTYSYMMTRNLFNTMSNNPKQFFKVALYAFALQQASTHLFLNKEERQNLKNGDQSWMKPTLWNSLRIDPSFASWDGKYNIVNYHTPFMTDLGGLNDSIHPAALISRAVVQQRDVEWIMNKQLKAYRKINGAARDIADTEYGKAFSQQLMTTRDL